MAFVTTRLDRRNEDVDESFRVFQSGPRDHRGQMALSGARVFENKHKPLASKDVDCVMIQHGLPGIEWRKKIEAKIRTLVQAHHDLVVLVLLPPGIRRDTKVLEMDRKEIDRCYALRPDFFDRPFEMSAYARNMFGPYADFLFGLPGARGKVHLVGQSYGAASILDLLRECHHRGDSYASAPNSINFLSPFIKISMDPEDTEHQLSVNSNGETLDLPTQKAMLTDHLRSMPECYRVDSASAVIEGHRRVFNGEFFRTLGDLSAMPHLKSCKVKVIRGGKDPFIGAPHTELIARKLGRKPADIETVLPEDGHCLPSFNFASVLNSY